MPNVWSSWRTNFQNLRTAYLVNFYLYSIKKSLYISYACVLTNKKKNMKKCAIFTILPLVWLIAGCGSNKIDITDTEFDVESCNKYFELVDCIFENDTDESYTEEMRDELRQEVKDMQGEWGDYSDEELDNICNSKLEVLKWIESKLNDIGCPLN